ncbi:TetR/AcrR family transcriptional regulator [Dyadobacter psychrotolerans]|uniref:TetR/AcrR family transcriptional regulator n=1 Tax=Dyadobacter psychrotolerans TaxID=2541721 RepID=A0A4R5DQZ7_9BACT|nr:TetR/AcrR family transcriptional regulator [Dyadobacter psychrotolerans]TDE14471.1 TetR/AcrR family transcriptional regulator [Dyadobacter psychrotolerans]
MPLTKDEILKEKILAGANRLFQKHGLTKTTMEDIAKEAGKGKSTLYYYFKSKEEIFDDIIQNEKSKFFSILLQAVADAPTARLKLNAFALTRFERLKEWTNLYNVMVQEALESLKNGGVDCVRYRKQYDQKEADIVKGILVFGMDNGEFRTFSESEIDALTFCCISSQHGLEFDLVLYDKMEELLPKINFLMEIMINGIRK